MRIANAATGIRSRRADPRASGYAVTGAGTGGEPWGELTSRRRNPKPLLARPEVVAVFSPANTGFMLLAASLVMLMTPGLAFFYGGLVGRSNTLSIMIQSFASMGITTVMWWLVGYSLCFSGGSDGIFGNFHNALLR